MPFYPRRKPARKGKKAPAKKTAKKNFTKAVKQIIHSEIENKIVSTYSANLAIKYAGSITNPTFINLTPQPILGTSSQQRIGNSIRVVKASIRGFVNVKQYDSVFNPMPAPIMIKMWLCRRVSDNTAKSSQPGTTDFANFFQSGATSLPMQSNMLDMTLKTNAEVWRVFATKTVILQNSYYAGATAGTTTILGSAYKVSAPFSFNFEKHLGLCKYNDSATYPQNKELYLVFQNVYADGSSSIAQLDLGEVHYNIEWQYEDA